VFDAAVDCANEDEALTDVQCDERALYFPRFDATPDTSSVKDAGNYAEEEDDTDL